MLPQDDADKLWLRMAARYGHAWVSQYGAQPDRFAGAEWRLTLAGLAESQLRAGFEADRSRGAEWPPSSTSFRMMCLGVPAIASVRREIGQRPESHSPFARLVWQNLDRWAFGHAEQRQADRMLREAYDLAREHVVGGGALPEQLVALVAPGKTEFREAAPEVAERTLGDIAQVLRAAPPTKAVSVVEPTVDLAAVEAELQAHYAKPTADAAAGES